MVTIKDVAKAAGVSYATVSRALNNVSGTKDSTAKRIKALADQMGYQRNTLAAGLVTKRTNTIGFILPEISNPFFTKILDAISAVADDYDFTVLVCSTAWDIQKEEIELARLRERRVDGILLYPSSDESVNAERLSSMNIPTVVYGEVFSASEEQSETNMNIVVDNISAGRLATEHLLACGYQRLAFIGGPERSASSADRLRGMRAYMQERELELDESLVSEEKYSIESGFERCDRLLSLPDAKRPDAFICGNDLIALGAMQAVADSPYKLGEDIGIIGFDDVPYASLPQIQLSTVKIPCKEMGETGMRMLLQAILEKEDLQRPVGPFAKVLFPSLIQRQTTKGGRR